MRFTRPGARPCHARGCSRLRSTELRGFIFRTGVDYECSGAELRPGQVLELVTRAVWWIELDVEVMVGADASGGRLMHGHHIWQCAVEEPVVLLQHALENFREGFVIIAVEVEQTRAMADRREVHLVRPARERGHERDPVPIAQHRALAARLARDHVAVQAATCLALVPGLGAELPLPDRWDERVCVDLPMGMAQRHADFLAAVFEDVDVANIGQPAQLAGAITPRLDEVTDVLDALLAER